MGIRVRAIHVTLTGEIGIDCEVGVRDGTAMECETPRGRLLAVGLVELDAGDRVKSESNLVFSFPSDARELRGPCRLVYTNFFGWLTAPTRSPSHLDQSQAPSAFGSATPGKKSWA